MLQSRQRRVLSEAQGGDAYAHAFARQLGMFRGPGIAQRDAGRRLRSGQRIAAACGRAAREEHLDNGARAWRGELLHFSAQDRFIGSREPQARAACGEALQVQLQKPRPTAHAGDGLKQTVAEMKTPLTSCAAACPGGG